MARLVYECDCGFKTDGNDTQAILEHESSCAIAKVEDELQELKEMIAYFTNTNSDTRVELVASLLTGLDVELREFYPEGMTSEGSLATIVAIKLFDFMIEMEGRLKSIESKLKGTEPEKVEEDTSDLQEVTEEYESPNKEEYDKYLEDKLFRASQDNLESVEDEEI